jgi:hypothetical protein
LLAWTPHGLPAGFGIRAGTLAGVRAVVEVRGDVLNVDAGDGYLAPLDTFAVDPDSYARLLPDAAARTMRGLGAGEGILGETGARLLDASVGDTVTPLDADPIRVVAIIDDTYVGGAQLVVARGRATASMTPRFLLVEYDGDRGELESLVGALAPGTQVRFRAPGETPYLRHGDAVLPLALVEDRFGVLRYRPAGGSRIDIDPRFAAAHLATRTLPHVGAVTCHRLVLDDLERALAGLSPRAAASITGGAPRCFDPHLAEAGLGPSRHAFGIAIAFSLTSDGHIDQEVVDAMQAAGFTWGGRWLLPEPQRFEWVGR